MWIIVLLLISSQTGAPCLRHQETPNHVHCWRRQGMLMGQLIKDKKKNFENVICNMWAILVRCHSLLLIIASLWCYMATEKWVTIGSGNGLLPDSIKPLPVQMLMYHQWYPLPFNWDQFCCKYSRYHIPEMGQKITLLKLQPYLPGVKGLIQVPKGWLFFIWALMYPTCPLRSTDGNRAVP